MAIVRWDPFGEMMSMQRDMDRLFSRLGMREGGNGDGERRWLPKVDVFNRGDDMVVRAELPGIKPEEVDISLTDNVLTLKGERREEHETKKEDYIVKESSFGKFERSMVLPEGVKPDDIQADFSEGVLEVTVKKAVEISRPKTTRIEIGAGK